MRVYTAIKGSEGVTSTSLTDIANFLGGSANAIRVHYCRHRVDVIDYLGGKVLRTELGRIKGRGSKSFGR